MTNLLHKISNALPIIFNRKFYWTDSTITLSWIQAEPNNWKTFVANRVSEIQGLSDSNDWYHINGKDNPADILSRGAIPQELGKSSLWWHGPEFLLSDESTWNLNNKLKFIGETSEKKQATLVLVNISNDDCVLSLINRKSRFTNLINITAYVLRFKHNVMIKDKSQRYVGELCVTEIDVALSLIIKTVQIECFPLEYSSFIKEKNISTSSNILNLKPFLFNGLIRVGGRLQNSKLPFDQKHPIMLPKNHHLTEIIIRHYHIKLLHCGVQMLLYSLREKYWVINGRNACKKVVLTCTKCFHVKPKSVNYLMGNLPYYRVESSFPFLHVGMDYGGPFLIKDRKGRGAKINKYYLSLFICMSSKAVHLELVTGLTTDAFLATLKRFMSRRGKPHHIYSDNGSNYIGANNQLQDLYAFLNHESTRISKDLSNERIVWHFIPAHSPTFGGLWEAGIKSAKFHIKRVVGDALFTYEDFSTVLCQIEGILNSRPLCPMSSDPHDMIPLTPAHLLIGRSLIALPEGDITSLPNNRLDQYQRIQACVQNFWTRWSKEFLTELQTRSKWRFPGSAKIEPGVLVLMKDEKLPPLRWSLGRICKTYPGTDNIIRVADVKTSQGTYRSAVNKLCVLPLEP